MIGDLGGGKNILGGTHGLHPAIRAFKQDETAWAELVHTVLENGCYRLPLSSMQEIAAGLGITIPPGTTAPRVLFILLKKELKKRRRGCPRYCPPSLHKHDLVTTGTGGAPRN